MLIVVVSRKTNYRLLAEKKIGSLGRNWLREGFYIFISNFCFDRLFGSSEVKFCFIIPKATWRLSIPLLTG